MADDLYKNKTEKDEKIKGQTKMCWRNKYFWKK